MIPLMLDLSDFRILVIGNGTVGRRKAAYFADSEVVIRDKVTDDLASEIAEFDIIIAATADAALNESICQEAAAQKKWYNSATGVGNFLIPAAYREGECTIAVSTSGKAPAVSAFIRDEITKAHPALPEMIELQETVRAELKASVEDQPRRAEILRAILEDAKIWEALDNGDREAALALSRRHA